MNDACCLMAELDGNIEKKTWLQMTVIRQPLWMIKSLPYVKITVIAVNSLLHVIKMNGGKITS